MLQKAGHRLLTRAARIAVAYRAATVRERSAGAFFSVLSKLVAELLEEGK